MCQYTCIFLAMLFGGIFFTIAPVLCMQLSGDCIYLLTTITFTIGDEVFTCSGKTVIDPGFTAIMPWQAIPPEESMPNCTVGETWAVNEVK